jgi:hypothetical protein
VQNEIQAEQKAWLDEHLPYELKMARYSFKQMQETGVFYLDWNAYHSAFTVAACNLAAFLTNQEKLKASDFAEGFKSRKRDLAGTFAKLEPQVISERPGQSMRGNLFCRRPKKFSIGSKLRWKSLLANLAHGDITGTTNGPFPNPAP